MYCAIELVRIESNDGKKAQRVTSQSSWSQPALAFGAGCLTRDYPPNTRPRLPDGSR
jgi:hypothetical protein